MSPRWSQSYLAAPRDWGPDVASLRHVCLYVYMCVCLVCVCVCLCMSACLYVFIAVSIRWWAIRSHSGLPPTLESFTLFSALETLAGGLSWSLTPAGTAQNQPSLFPSNSWLLPTSLGIPELPWSPFSFNKSTSDYPVP